ncbi:MAG: hypothetical protein GF334_07040 [Candidatus Altiarchaeales archaeon]|nr:hypothetical protein [Candidatus Altiarchaeales archaeon]
MTSFKNFWQSEELQSKYIEMLGYVIDKAEDVPNIVGIDVMNEPWPRFPPMPFERKRLTTFYEKVQELFIQKKTRLKMFYEPWMSTSSGVPTNLRFKPKHPAVFFPHFYDAFCEEGSTYKSWNKELQKRAVEIKVREAQKFGVPVAFGEFSYPSNCKKHLDALTDFIDLSDKHAFGWCYYSYESTLYHDRGLVLPDGTETSMLRRLVRPYPQRIAGRNPHIKLTKKSLYLRYDTSPDVTGDTFIFVPPGKVYNISCSGTAWLAHNRVAHTNSNDKTQFVIIEFVQ